VPVTSGHADVVVIGGGIMGCAIAHQLAIRGARTVVLERSVPGAEASSVAAGILAPRIEQSRGAALRIGIDSLERHAPLAARLRDELGIDVGLRLCGAIALAWDERELRELEARAATLGSTAEAELLDGDEARRREPKISRQAIGALDLPREAQVEPPLLLRAIALAAERAGAVFRSGSAVRQVRVERDRARGVVLEDGSLDAGHVIVAAGSWTALVPGLPADPASRVRPIRGQLVHAELRPPIARRVLFGAGAYVVPRPDGRVVCGATMEDVGFRKEATLGGIGEVIARAIRIAPDLAGAAIGAHAVSFRPWSPDDLPLVGAAGPDGLWLATGHHRNGILLAPLTASVIADLVTDGRTTIADADAMDPRRFARSEIA
jgi:glycine oxidase